jgi:hypothetical protein
MGTSFVVAQAFPADLSVDIDERFAVKLWASQGQLPSHESRGEPAGEVVEAGGGHGWLLFLMMRSRACSLFQL